MSCLETDKDPLMKTYQELLFCLSQTTTSGGRVTYKFLKPIPPPYLQLAVNPDMAVQSYVSRKVSEQIPFILDLGRYWKRKSEDVAETGSLQKDGAMVVPSIPTIECQFYTQYTLSVGSADRCRWKIVGYESCRME